MAHVGVVTLEEEELRTRLLSALGQEPVAAVQVSAGAGNQLRAVIRLRGEPDADETRAVFERHRADVLRALAAGWDADRDVRFDVRIRPAEVRLVVHRQAKGAARVVVAATPDSGEPAPARGATTPVMTRLDPRSIEALDLLVEAGLRGSRSEAVSWCVRQTLAREAERIAGLRAPVLALRLARADLARPAVAGAVVETVHQVLRRAEHEARARGYRYVGTEHLFLALLGEESSGVTAVLADAGVNPEPARHAVAQEIPPVHASPDGPGPLEFTPLAARVVDEISVEEARQAGAPELRPAHLLLGLVAAGTGTAWRALRDAGADLTRLRAVVAGRRNAP